MSKFVTGELLEEKITDIIWDAKETLLIVSPFIRLDDFFKKLFLKHENDDNLHIIIVFGKNENNVSKSLNKIDFEFFKKFPNISIIYAPNLHGKYYGNEKQGIITSINFHDHSFQNNIEFGVFTEQNLISQLGGNLDLSAWDACLDIANNNDVIFIKRPVYKLKKILITIGKEYLKSEILLDNTSHFYGRTSTTYKPQRLSEFEEEITSDTIRKPVRESVIEEPIKSWREKTPQYGYCIRTGERIRYNPERPFSYYAWKTWNEFQNMDFAENYCHRTGKPSYGKTSMRKPILD